MPASSQSASVSSANARTPGSSQPLSPRLARAPILSPANLRRTPDAPPTPLESPPFRPESRKTG